MKRSETVGNGRKQSETWSGQNLSNPHLKINISAQRNFFFEGPKVSKGKPLEIVGDRTFARQIYWLIAFHLWKADPVQTRANHDAYVFSCDPCARTLHQILHFDLDIQYSLKITKPQELVKFNICMYTSVNI